MSFEIAEGETCGLVGPNGAGKSTLIKVILGVERRDSGSIEFGTAQRSIAGYVPEKAIFFEDLSAYHNLLYFARLAKLDDAEQRSRKLLQEFGLSGREDDYLSSYSKGMRQRLSMARAVMHHPTILFMDEPFSGLDPSMVIEIRETLKRLKAQGMTVMLSSHDLSEVDQVCSSILFIDHGKVVTKESLESDEAIGVELVVKSRTPQIEAALGPWGGKIVRWDERTVTIDAERKEIPQIVKAVVDSGGMVEEVNLLRRKAEDRYTALFMKGGR